MLLQLFHPILIKKNQNTNEKFQKYTETNDKAKEWDALMKNYQEKIPNSNGEWWSEMTMAYDSEWK